MRFCFERGWNLDAVQEVRMKKRVYLLVGLLLAAMFSFTLTANADEVEEELTNAYVLQNGGMLSEKGMINMKTRGTGDLAGAQEAIITAMEELDDQVDISSYQVTYDQLVQVYSQMMNDHPSLFYVAKVNPWCNSTTNIVLWLDITYKYDKTTIQVMKSEYEYEVEIILSKVQSNWSDMEKILFVNDYLATNCRYEDEVFNDTSLEVYDVYAVFVKKKAVCQGYALAFMDLMDRLGISCELVTSDILWHAWNIVELDGEWYQVDVTWNDPTSPDELGRAMSRVRN